MLNQSIPLHLSPKTEKIKNKQKLSQKVPEELLNYSPLNSLMLPKNSQIRQQFQKFLLGNINEKEFIKQKCFPNVFIKNIQNMKKVRNRQEEFTFHLQRQIAKEKAKQRWNKIQQIVQQNILLRRQTGKYETKIIGRLELGMQLQNQEFENNSIQDSLESHKLRTMIVLKEKNKQQNQSSFISPKHYNFVLQEQFKSNTNEYLYNNQNILPNTKSLSDEEYNILLNTYINKKQLYENYQNQQKQRKTIRWRQLSTTNTFLNTCNSSQTFLNKDQPMSRLPNPLLKQIKQRNYESQLIYKINEIENPKMYIEKVNNNFIKKSNSQQKLTGIVKHNRIISMDNNNIYQDNNNDDGLDMSNASITEALLDQLYLGSQKMQARLRSSMTIQKKVKDILRLEEMKMNTINANYQKLNKYQQKQQ